jgi:hypothetical protein
MRGSVAICLDEHGLLIDHLREIAPALFGLRADILFFARAKKMYAKESTPPILTCPPLVRFRTKGRAQWGVRHGCRTSAVATGCRVGANPEHGPSGGVRRAAAVPSRGVLSFGGWSTVPRSVGAGPVAKTPRPAHFIQPPCPRSRTVVLRTHRVAVAFSLHEQRKVTRPQGEKDWCNFAVTPDQAITQQRVFAIPIDRKPGQGNN